MLPRSVVTGLTVLISLAWTVNVVVGFIRPDRHDPMLNAIFAVVVGAVYALGRKINPGAGTSEEDHSTRDSDG